LEFVEWQPSTAWPARASDDGVPSGATLLFASPVASTSSSVSSAHWWS